MVRRGSGWNNNHTHNFTIYKTAILCLVHDKKMEGVYVCSVASCTAEEARAEGPCANCAET